MRIRRFYGRLHGYYQCQTARLLFRRPLVINAQYPVISFTFDDFPRSALRVGGLILNRLGLCGTYYASLGLLGKTTLTGQIAGADDLGILLEQNHELGCHTFSHCDSWETGTEQFEASIIANRAALARIIPTSAFRSFSYPISPPRALTKAMVSRHFPCCRGGGQTINVGTADLNYLSAYFLEKNGNCIQPVKEIIDRNQQNRGWLIFATHDISENHSPYGCTPKFFEDVVQYAVRSGARIVPVAKALDVLLPGQSQPTKTA